MCGYHRSMIYMNVSHALAGVAVLADMLLTTHFMTLVLLTVWKLPLWVCALFYIAFAPIEATFWSSTLIKIPNGVARCAALFVAFKRLTAEAMAWLYCSTYTCCNEVIFHSLRAAAYTPELCTRRRLVHAVPGFRQRLAHAALVLGQQQEAGLLPPHDGAAGKLPEAGAGLGQPAVDDHRAAEGAAQCVRVEHQARAGCDLSLQAILKCRCNVTPEAAVEISILKFKQS